MSKLKSITPITVVPNRAPEVVDVPTVLARIQNATLRIAMVRAAIKGLDGDTESSPELVREAIHRELMEVESGLYWLRHLPAEVLALPARTDEDLKFERLGQIVIRPVNYEHLDELLPAESDREAQ
jgi:hypothetical protein